MSEMEWTYSAGLGSEPEEPLTLDEVLCTLASLGPPPRAPNPISFLDGKERLFGTPVYTSVYLGIDIPIDYSARAWWVRLRLRYERFMRRIGAEMPWQPLPLTRKSPEALMMSHGAMIVSPQVNSALLRISA
jgi:hypothetical protein